MKNFFYLLLITLLLVGCAPKVLITHSPVIAKSSETVNFTATLQNDGKGPCRIDILVNTALVMTCNNLSTGDTCSYIGGPYTTLEGSTVSYRVLATDSIGKTDSRGYCYFAITDNDYNWALDCMPARRTGKRTQKLNFVFHKADDYTSFGDFVDDIEDKMYDVYLQQDIIKKTDNFDTFNFYVYSKVAGSGNCGTVHADTNTDIPWREVDAVLHTANLGDCTNVGLTHFSAEGHNTKAFLHESGHAVFALADEYDGPTHYFQPLNEPNIWSTESACRAEQRSKRRDPNKCWEFTTRTGGWWGIHGLGDNTVMQIGNVGDPWGIESEEHNVWYFDLY